MKHMLVAAALALGAGGLAACGQPTTTTETTTTETAAVEPAAPVMEAAQPFLDKVAAWDMLEIEASKAAQTKSKNAEVKALAAMLVKEHTKTSTELKAWATSNPGFTLPTAAPADVQSSIDNIKNAAADEGFDDKYLDTVIDTHEDAIELVGKYATNGDNESLKQWAAATLPVLKGHFDQATALRDKLNKA